MHGSNLVDQGAKPQVDRTIVLVSAFGAAVTALWGYDTVACNGLMAGALSALLRASFLVFVHAWTLAACLGLFLLFLGLAYGLARCGFMRQRQELLTLALPVFAFAAGAASANLGNVGLMCALHPWA